MQHLVFAHFVVGIEALLGRWEGEDAEGLPEVFADVRGDGLFAGVGYLFDSFLVLEDELDRARRDVRACSYP